MIKKKNKNTVTKKELKRLHDIQKEIHFFVTMGTWRSGIDSDSGQQILQSAYRRGEEGKRFFNSLIHKYIGKDADVNAYRITGDKGEIVPR
jgi:hypothetical protein